MTIQDSRGVALSTTRTASAAAYDQTLDLFNSYRLDPLAVITPVLQEDTDFISGHLLMAGMILGTYDPQMSAMAKGSLDLAAASKLAPTAREQSLHAALLLWADGDLDAGNRRLDRHLIDHPRDLLALQLGHVGDLMLGRTTMLRDRIARALGYWSENDAGYGYLLGMLAFGLEECFAYNQAEDIGRRAVSLQPHDAWAIHAVAHVCEMQGRAADGIRWMNQTYAGWAEDNGLSLHNHWHLALMHLAGGDHRAVLTCYDSRVAPTEESLALNLCDASALLWRLYLRGVDVGDRWSELSRRWQQHALLGRSVFLDVHAAIAFAAAGNVDGTAALKRSISQAASLPSTATDAVWRSVAAPVCEAISAILDGRPGRCAELLLPVLPIAAAMGGSHAQRDLLRLTAQEAAHRNGDGALANALRAQRHVLVDAYAELRGTRSLVAA